MAGKQIVPGGGVALLRASSTLESLAKDGSLDSDERLGVEIVRRATEEPTRWIAQNAGLEGSIVAATIKESSDTHWGFNAQTEALVSEIPEKEQPAAAHQHSPGMDDY